MSADTHMNPAPFETEGWVSIAKPYPWTRYRYSGPYFALDDGKRIQEWDMVSEESAKMLSELLRDSRSNYDKVRAFLDTLPAPQILPR